MSLTFERLMADKRYREYFLKAPDLPVASRPNSPYYLYVQLEGQSSWRRKLEPTYRQAFVDLKSYREHGARDLVIVSRRVSFSPPARWVKVVRDGRPVMVKNSKGIESQQLRQVVWKWDHLLDSTVDGPHRWCPYCRRPTEFRYFPDGHHALRKAPAYDPTARRCSICGISEGGARYGR